MEKKDWNWRELFRERFVVEENTEEQYLRKHDHRTIIEELEHFIEEELDKAREEGRGEQAELDRALYSVSFEHIKNADFEKILLEYVDKARREYFSMGMEYFSLIDDSNIYQKKGWKLPKEKAERLQILGEIFNLINKQIL